jgi:hypothetical protein
MAGAGAIIAGSLQGIGDIFGGLADIGIGSISRQNEINAVGENQQELERLRIDAEKKAGQRNINMIFIGFAFLLVGFILYKALK